MGLCYKCGAKWSKDHKCSPEVLLVVEVVWDSVDALLDANSSSELTLEPASDPAQLFLAISKYAVGDSSTGRVIRLSGLVQGNSVMIPVDSVSSASFVSTYLAACLTEVTSKPISTQVHVASGSLLSSSQLIQQLQWSVDSCSFVSGFRVLTLGSYDMIVGMDWLSSFSPMQIHWQQQWLVIPYQGQWVML